MVSIAKTDILLTGCPCDVGVRIRFTSEGEAAFLGRGLLNIVVKAGSFVYESAIILLPEEPKRRAD